VPADREGGEHDGQVGLLLLEALPQARQIRLTLTDYEPTAAGAGVSGPSLSCDRYSIAGPSESPMITAARV